MLHLIRHGETALNAARVLQPADTPLSARGRAQAAALARRLAGAGLAGILSSDLPRARETAEAIAAVTGLALDFSPLLHERNFGSLRGLPYDTLGYDPLSSEAAPPGGESMAEFSRRAAAAWRELLELRRRVGGPLAVISHGLVLREWLASGLLCLPSGQPAPERLANTSLTIATAAPPHAVQLLNCTRHLNESAQDDARSLSGA